MTSEWDRKIAAHQEKLTVLEAIPDPDWAERGSINYHRDAIRLIGVLRRREAKAEKDA